MVQETNVEPAEKPINYLLAIIGAIGGAAIGIAFWAVAAYFTDSFYLFTPVLIGALAGGGAARLGGRGHISLAILGLIIGGIGVVLGDFAETAAIQGRLDISLDEYISIMQATLEDDWLRRILYLAGAGAGFLSGLLNLYGGDDD